MELSGTIRLEWLIGFGLVSWGATKLFRMGRREADLPPGPPTVPILGNVPVMPKSSVYLHLTTWARQYGEIYSLIGGPTGTVVVLSSPRAIHEVLEKQGAITANRPQKVAVQIVTGGLSVGLSNYNHYWKATRRAASEILKPQACARHMPIQNAEATQLMFDMLYYPKDTFYHINRFAISSMLSVMFGQRTPHFSSPFITNFINLFNRLSIITSLEGTPPLELFPFLKYVPERWAPWKVICRTAHDDMQSMFFGLVDESIKRTGRGEANGCYIETVLDMSETFKLTKEEISYFGFSMISGGTQTVTAWLQFFALIMAKYPEVAKKAQVEIDSVVGIERAPQLKDMESMPYLQAIIKEVSRFRPILPVILPHVASEDAAFKDYRIPSGSLILANVWAIFRNENYFENPDAFEPERYMRSPLGLRKEVEIDDEEAFRRLNVLPWGSGRRSCPGIHLAHQILHMNVINLLWAFDFKKNIDPDSGKEIEPDLWAFSATATVEVNPYVANPVVRSPAHAEIIRRNYYASSDIFEQFERELCSVDRQYVADTRTGRL